MITFIAEVVASADTRWDEINGLLTQASKCSDLVHDYLCRAATIMVVAHFEGLLKSLVRAAINDLNKFDQFRNAPRETQREYCRIFTGRPTQDAGPTAEQNQREEKLVALFEASGAKIDHTVLDGGLANPKPKVISKVMSGIGVPTFFRLIQGSRLDSVFWTEGAARDALSSELRQHLLDTTDVYPYSSDRSRFGIAAGAASAPSSDETLWESFVNDLLNRRHQIAHGQSLESSLSIGDVSDAFRKTRILSYAAILAVCTSDKWQRRKASISAPMS